MGQSRLKRWISMVIFSAILLLLSVLAIPSLAQGAQGDKGIHRIKVLILTK